MYFLSHAKLRWFRNISHTANICAKSLWFQLQWLLNTYSHLPWCLYCLYQISNALSTFIYCIFLDQMSVPSSKLWGPRRSISALAAIGTMEPSVERKRECCFIQSDQLICQLKNVCACISDDVSSFLPAPLLLLFKSLMETWIVPQRVGRGGTSVIQLSLTLLGQMRNTFLDPAPNSLWRRQSCLIPSTQIGLS